MPRGPARGYDRWAPDHLLMLSERTLRWLSAAALFALATFLLAIVFWPTDDAWSAVAKVLVGLFIVPMAGGVILLGVWVLRRKPHAEAGALVLLSVLGVFTFSSMDHERWWMLGILAAAALPSVLLAARGAGTPKAGGEARP